MFRCRTCGVSIRQNREKQGARCPHCCSPVFEQPYDPHEGNAAAGQCAVHAGNPAVGTCPRCGTYMCRLCRTRWLESVLCVACVERAIQAREAASSEVRSHFRQALMATLFGVGGWVLWILGVLLVALGLGGDDPNFALAGLGALLFMIALVPAVLGVGQGAAAIRTRGNHMILATFGLILSGLQVGVMVGLITMQVVTKE